MCQKNLRGRMETKKACPKKSLIVRHCGERGYRDHGEFGGQIQSLAHLCLVQTTLQEKLSWHG